MPEYIVTRVLIRYFKIGGIMENGYEAVELNGMSEVGGMPSIHFAGSRSVQIAAALLATIGSFAFGTTIGWSSPGIPNLREGGQLGYLSESDGSWIGSILTVGALFSPFISGFLMQRIGRKLTMILIGIPFVAGWIFTAAAQNLEMLLAGRFLTGFSGSAYMLLVPVYVSEISEDHIRGLLSSANGVSLVAGILFSYILGALVSWVTLSIVCIIFPVLFMVTFIFMPESPSYLLEKGDTKSAAASLQRLRGATRRDQIEIELKLIKSSVQESNARPSSLKDLFELSVLKPVVLTMMLMLLQQLGGITAFLFYTATIFESVGSDMDPNLATIIIGIVPVVMVAISAVLVDRAGRKILLIISEIGMAIGLIGLGICFTMKANNDDKIPDGLGWLPLACLIFYMITYNVGVGPLPWVIMGEVLPPHIKGLAGALAASVCWGSAFFVAFTFAKISDLIGPEGCYFIFGGCSIAGALFAIFVVPETKGKSLDEIQLMFK